MNETQRNIKQYKAALPGLRERIAASAMLLLVSLSMVVSASFAWYTISIAPEVSLIATTVASNGNLEIALAHGTVQEDTSKREEPDEVALGDSSSAQGQSLVEANITWGNLVNLSPETYGLSHVSLRPATLTDNNQSRTPLKGVDYTVDGRFIESNDFYRYATYDEKYGGNGGFRAGEGNVQYGVRAISSMILSNDEEQSEINEMGAVADEKFSEAKKAYDDIIKGNAKTQTGESCMDALVKLLEKFVNDKACDVASTHSTVTSIVGKATYTPTDYGPMISDLRDLMVAFRSMLEKESEAIRSIANIYLFNQTGDKEYIAKGEDLREYGRTTNGRKSLQDLGVPSSLTDVLKIHVSDYDVLSATIDEIENHLIKERVEEGFKVYWDSDYMAYQEGQEAADAANTNDFLNHYITNLVDLGYTYVGPIKNSDTGAIKFIPVMSLAGLSDAQALLNAEPIEVEIRKGILKNTEDRLGAILAENSAANDMNRLGKRVTITIDVKLDVEKNQGLLNIALNALDIEGPKTAAVRTNAGRDGSPAKLSSEIGAAKRLVPEPKNMVSKDIYGFAIDLWVRTNAHDTILTLEGMTEYEEVRGTCTDINGDTRELWTATGTVMEEVNGEMVEVEHVFDCYIINEPAVKLDENGDPVMNGDQPVMENVDHVYDALGNGIVGIRDDMMSEEGGYTFTPKMVKVYKGFHGENRVWQEMIDGGYVTEDSTTQGAGSCYVFYASPTEQSKILEMLESFTIAFIDGKDNLVATAKLNTAEAFAVNGKVTVPLLVVTGVAYDELVEGSEEVVSKKGIMEMPWGEATWLTAIVYLDGKDIGNDNVLAAGSIEGSLNLQFGSSVDINSQKNEPLLQKFRTITAVLKGNGTEDNGTAEKPAIEFVYDKNEKMVTAELTITGDQPNNVTAFLTRMVGKNQGSRMETKTFQRDGSTNKWTAEFYLTNPGEYRLNSVVADGVEYTLEKKPGAKITGQSTSVITCTPGDGSVMTSAEYYDIQLDMNISTTSADLQPDSVSVMFSYGDGKVAVANMSPIGNGNWRGKLHITESGNYIMSYLVIDGNEDLVDQQTSIFVRVGMDVQVTCDSILGPDGSTLENQSKDPSTFSILFEPPGEDSAYTARLRVELFDGSGAEIERMSGLKLVYPLESDKSFVIDGDMYWVENAGGYYQVEVPFKEAGTYVFGSVQMDDETVLCNITSASEAVKISAVPPDPPMLTAAPNNTVEFQYVPNSSTPATMSVTVFDSKAAIVQAEIVNLITGQSGWVDMTKKSVASTDPNHKTLETYTAVIPKNNLSNQTGTAGIENEVDGQTIGYVGNCNGSQDGIWVLKQLRMQQVTDENENYYPADTDADAKYLYFDMNAYGIRTEVMEKVFYSFAQKSGVEYRSQTLNGGILETHQIKDVVFKISDWRGSTEHLRNVKLNVTHGGDSGDKGGYSYGTVPAQEWKVNGSNLDTLSLQIAGTYTVSLSHDVIVDGNKVSSYGPAETGLTFTVKSNVPTVKIKSTSQDEKTSVYVNNSVNTSGERVEVPIPAKTDYTATVYIEYYYEKGGACESDTHEYTNPDVTLTLEGVGAVESAELVFTCKEGGDSHVYNGNTRTGSYLWTKDGECVRGIGYVYPDKSSKNAAQTLIANELKVMRGGVTVTFTITEITISNPY